MVRSFRRWGAQAGFVLTSTALTLMSMTASAVAAEGTIDHVEATAGKVQILYSVPGIGQGVTPDLASVSATVDGEQVEATAALAADSKEGVRRTTVLAIDVSNSMRGARFDEAKRAAVTYLEAAPLDVFVGIVAFAGEVEVIQEPTLNRAAAISTIDDLQLTSQTRLYDGIRRAVRTAGVDGQRSVLVLSDGADTSQTPIEDVTGDIAKAKIKVDVVALAQSAKNRQKLAAIADAGKGSVLEAGDPAALSDVFASEAASLAKQVLITATIPPTLKATEATVEVSIVADGASFADSAYVTVVESGAAEEAVSLAKRDTSSPAAGPAVSRTTMLLGLGAIGVGAMFVLLAALGVLSPRKTERLEDHIAAYTRQGDATQAMRSTARPATRSVPSADSMAGSARAMAEKALSGNKGMEAALGSRLEAAGMSVKPAEWLLTQAGIAFGAALLGMLFGSILVALVFLALGVVVPYIYLGFKRRRRVKAFNNQLADTLQLMAGSLSAGLSLTQSVDTVVREGSEPITAEFKRALVEARLGVATEDALDSVAQRMESEDFRWVVMAVRIQREVGGNLAEVLTQVAATIRERAYLRRQVKSLSAEGVLSAYILGGLPIFVLLFLLTTRPGYLEPMISTGVGWALMGAACFLMMAGALWLRKIVRMEV